MKKILLLFAVLLLFSCKEEKKAEPLYPKTEPLKLSPVALGKEIFEGKGKCFSCHQPEQKVVGPSIREVASTYKEKKGDIVLFLKEEAQPIVDPALYETMKANFAVTKTMSDEELKALEAYIYSFSK